MKMTFFEAPAFTRHLGKYMGDDEYRMLQHALLNNPDAGDVIRGTGGFRKLRWPDSRRGKGTRGGLRIIYYHFLKDNQIWLFTLYGKGEVNDLNEDQKRALKKAIEIEKKARRMI